MAALSRLWNAVLEGDTDEARDATQAALDAGADPIELIDKAATAVEAAKRLVSA